MVENTDICKVFSDEFLKIMTKNRIVLQLIIVSILFVFSSCITNKNLEYISSENDNLNLVKYEYVVQKEDLLSVQISSTTHSDYDFFNLEQTNNAQLMNYNPYLSGYLVKQNGVLELPMFGEIKVEGFTLREIEKVIQQIAKTYFKDPVVKVNLINFTVSILGEVQRAGKYNIVKSNQNIYHLIGMAFDLTEYADRKNIKIIRTENGASRIVHLDLTDPNIVSDKDFYLHPHDIVYVEPLLKKFFTLKNLPSTVSMGISAITLYLLLTRN